MNDRDEHRRLLAALTRRFGAQHLSLAENAIQDAYVRALERWPRDGRPGDPEAWLLRVAHNRMVDELRREQRQSALSIEREDEAQLPGPALDDELALMFLCCHPVLPRSAQLALTLRLACGFTAPQIASAFFSEEKTISQRLFRAKQRLRDENARFDLPEPDELPQRLESLLDVLYLVFNEGYSPTDGQAAIKDELCAQALRLSRILTELPASAKPAAFALRALFCFQYSRAAARCAEDGSLLLLAEQDRRRWDTVLMEEGFACLAQASEGAELSRFHLEAGIAACHAAAPTHDATDWPRILSLYDLLRARAPSPIVEVNRAVAVAMVHGALAGLDELDAIPERELVSSHPYALATYAELHASLGQLTEARSYLSLALEHQPSRAQRALLERKLHSLRR